MSGYSEPQNRTPNSKPRTLSSRPMPARKPKPTPTPSGKPGPGERAKRVLDAMHRSVLALPLRQFIAKGEPGQLYPIIIDINWRFVGGRPAAKSQIKKLLEEILKSPGSDPNLVDERKSALTDQYIFAQLQEAVIRELITRDRSGGSGETNHAIYRIWPDFEVERQISKSIVTIKADAVRKVRRFGGRVRR